MKILRRKRKEEDTKTISESAIGYPIKEGVSFYCRRPFSESRIKVEVIRTERGIEEVILKGYGKIPLRAASLILTGAGSQSKTGVFNRNKVVTFRYKDEQDCFTFEKIDWKNEDSYFIKEELKDRICQIQNWVESIDNYNDPQSNCDDNSYTYKEKWKFIPQVYQDYHEDKKK